MSDFDYKCFLREQEILEAEAEAEETSMEWQVLPQIETDKLRLLQKLDTPDIEPSEWLYFTRSEQADTLVRRGWARCAAENFCKSDTYYEAWREASQVATKSGDAERVKRIYFDLMFDGSGESSPIFVQNFSDSLGQTASLTESRKADPDKIDPIPKVLDRTEMFRDRAGNHGGAGNNEMRKAVAAEISSNWFLYKDQSRISSEISALNAVKRKMRSQALNA